MGLLDQIGDKAQAIGEGGLGLLGTVGEIYFAAKSPAGYAAMKKDSERKRLKAERASYVQGLLGMQQGTPDKNLAPDAFNMEEARTMQNLFPEDNYFQQGQSPATQAQTAAYMMGSEYPGQQKAGADLFADTFDKEKQQDLYYGLKQGAGGNTFGINRNTNRMENVPGANIPQPERSPLVENNIGVDTGPKPPQGMQRRKDPVTGEYSFYPVKGGKFDKKGYANVMKQTDAYNKDNFMYDAVLSQIDNYSTIQKNVGMQVNPYSAEGKLLDQAQTEVVMGLKEAWNLGVLQGTDEVLINRVIPKSTGLVNYSAISNEEMQGLLTRAREGIMKKKGLTRKQYPYADITENEEDKFNRLESEGM